MNKVIVISRTKGRRPLKFSENLAKGSQSSYTKTQIPSFKNVAYSAQNLPRGIHPTPMCGRGLTLICCQHLSKMKDYSISSDQVKVAKFLLSKLFLDFLEYFITKREFAMRASEWRLSHQNRPCVFYIPGARGSNRPPPLYLQIT